MSEIGPEFVKHTHLGWLCPVCHHVYAPMVTECPRCGKSLDKGDVLTKPQKWRKDAIGTLIPPGWAQSDKKCDKCGKKMLYDTRTMMTTYPPQRAFMCPKCGYRTTEVIGPPPTPYSITLNNGVIDAKEIRSDDP